MRKIYLGLVVSGIIWGLTIENGGDKGVLIAESMDNPYLAGDIPGDLICWYQPGSLNVTSNVVQTEVIPTMVRVVPPKIYITKNKVFTVNIEVVNVTDLAGIQLCLYFDKNKLTPKGIPTRGSLFGKGKWPVEPIVDNKKGYIFINDVLLSGLAQGTGTVAENITFSSLAELPSELIFGTVTLLKSDFVTEIPCATETAMILPYFDHFDLLVPIDVIAGRPWTMTVTAKDIQNKVYQNYQGTYVIIPNSGTIKCQIPKFSKGVSIPTITRNEPGIMILTVKNSDVSTQTPPIMVKYLCDFGKSFTSNECDHKIGFEDLVWFARYWRAYYAGGSPSSWAKGDVGNKAITGSPPGIISNPDGKIDFWDLVIFAKMWKWSQGGGKAMALEAPKFSLSQERVSPEKDEEFNVDITAEAKNLIGVNIELDYDPAEIELISLEEGDYFRKENLLTSKDNTISIASLDNMEGISNSAILSRARFKAKGSETSKIKINISYLVAEDEVKETSLELTVGPPPYSALFQSVPNPAKDKVFIPFQLSEGGETKLTIYNILGQVVREIGPEYKPMGYYTLKNKKALCWDLRNNAGQKVANGLYFYKLSSGKFSEIKSMVISK